MSWSQEQAKLLIELYKSYPCLYAVKHNDYKNKHPRNNVLEKICLELQLFRPCVNITELKNKYNNIRTNFLSEHRKYKNSFKSGMGTDEIYKPNIWYYDQMQFILEHSTVRQSVDSISTSIGSPLSPTTPDSGKNSLEESFSFSQNSIDNYEMETNSTINYEESQYNSDPDHRIDILRVDTIKPRVESNSNPSTSTTGIAPNLTSNKTANLDVVNKKKRKLQEINEDEIIRSANKVFKEISTALTAGSETPQIVPRIRTRSEIFGEFVTNQLSLIEEDEEIFLDTQHVIYNALHDARKKIIVKKRL